MKSLSLVFYTHQPIFLKNYRFFEIGKDHNYFNTSFNTEAIQKLEQKSFRPVNKLLLDIFQRTDIHFKISFSLSGTTLDLLETSSPSLIKDLKTINDLGSVEFLSQIYSHSILSLKCQHEFMQQTIAQKQKIFNIFGQIPKTFLNASGYAPSTLIKVLPELGFKVWVQPKNLQEELLPAEHPNFYKTETETNQKLGVLMANNLFVQNLFKSEKPEKLDCQYFKKILSWIENNFKENEVLCLLFDFADLHQGSPYGKHVLQLLKNLPDFAKEKGIGFFTPSELQLTNKYKSAQVPKCGSEFSKQENTLDTNALQSEIIVLLNSLKEKVYATKNKEILKTWFYLQDKWHFRQLENLNGAGLGMQDTAVKTYINLRNILKDFGNRVEQHLIHEKNKGQEKFQISTPHLRTQAEPYHGGNYFRLF